MKTRILLQTACVLAVMAFSARVSISTCLAQGSLTPPGPPTAGMLTLSQVEPRTPVDAFHTPGNGSCEFAITTPGSYYLTTNIVGVTSKDGIDISANNVTLDLNGFSLLGASSSNFNHGVFIFQTCTNITVRNGISSGWGGNGFLNQGNNVILEHLLSSGNATYGIATYYGVATVRSCMTSGNRYIGIAVVGNGCLIADNVCSGDNWANNPTTGGIIFIGNYNRIEGNHVTPAGAGIGIGMVSGNPCTNNIFIRNSVEGIGSGGTDYYFNSLQVVGPIITNAVSGIITNSNPWANFGF